MLKSFQTALHVIQYSLLRTGVPIFSCVIILHTVMHTVSEQWEKKQSFLVHIIIQDLLESDTQSFSQMTCQFKIHAFLYSRVLTPSLIDLRASTNQQQLNIFQMPPSTPHTTHSQPNLAKLYMQSTCSNSHTKADYKPHDPNQHSQFPSKYYSNIHRCRTTASEPTRVHPDLFTYTTVQPFLKLEEYCLLENKRKLE